jgi:hypothetical protein
VVQQLCFDRLSDAGPDAVFTEVTQTVETQNRAAKLTAASPIRRVSKELLDADVTGRVQSSFVLEEVPLPVFW